MKNIFHLLFIAQLVLLPAIVSAELFPGPGGQASFKNVRDATANPRVKLISENLDSAKYRVSDSVGVVRAEDLYMYGNRGYDNEFDTDGLYFPDDAYRFKYSLRHESDSGKNAGNKTNAYLMKAYDSGNHSLYAGMADARGTSISGTRLPIPAVMYEYSGDTLHVIAGLPSTQIRYNISEKFAYKMEYLPFKNLSASLEYSLKEGLLAAFDVSTDKYALELPAVFGPGSVNRPKSHKAGVSLAKQFSDSLSVYGSVGYLFDERLNVDERKKSGRDGAGYPDSSYFNLGVKYNF